MNCEDKISGEQLEDAFQLFNQLSKKLAASYGDLEAKVAHLSTELAEARSERLQQLEEKELVAKRLEILLDTLPAGIVVLDSNGIINQANPVAFDMLGFNLHGQSWETVAQEIFTANVDELRLKDGRWVNVSVSPLDVESGKIILVTDITEIHTLQKTISRQQRLTSLGEIIASLAHQIRTPLAAALLFLSNRSHPLVQSADKDRYIEKARERLGHLDRMVNDMLIFARGGVSESECFGMEQFVDQLRQLLEPQFANSQAILSIENQVTVENLRGNCDALLSAFQNLATNAIEAGGDTPALEIKVSYSSNESVEFCFTDNGCGIPDNIRDRVLEPFFTTRTSGTGLGLSVVNATVVGHHGELRIESAVGVGSCFTITLPLLDQHGMLSSDLVNTENTVVQLLKHDKYKKNETNYLHDHKEVRI